MSLDWDTKENQLKRFEIFSKIGDLNGKKILDVGCGLGDLYGFLIKKYKGIDYCGIDIAPKMIASARHKYPKARFENKEATEINEKFDYIFASGSLTFAVKQHKKYYLELIKKMYDLAKHGVAFNMLDQKVYRANDLYLTYDPMKILEFCRTFAKDTKIITGYVEGDFTVYLYKK